MTATKFLISVWVDANCPLNFEPFERMSMKQIDKLFDWLKHQKDNSLIDEDLEEAIILLTMVLKPNQAVLEQQQQQHPKIPKPKVTRADVICYHAIFNGINMGVVAQGGNAVPFSDTKYYTDQIANFLDDSDKPVDIEWVEALARALAVHDIDNTRN